MKSSLLLLLAVVVLLFFSLSRNDKSKCKHHRRPTTSLFKQAFGDDGGYPSLIDGELFYKYDEHRLTGNKAIEPFCTGAKCPYCD